VPLQNLDLTKYRIIAVDDEPENLEIFRFHFRDEFEISFAKNADEALERLATQEYAVIVTDQRMPKKTGLDLLKEAKQKYPKTIGVIVSAYSDIEIILSALNSGAVYRYVVKPWKKDDLFTTIKDAIERFAIAEENTKLVAQLKGLNAYLNAEDKLRAGEPVGLQGGLKPAGDKAKQVSPTNATVLLLGESGSGKEVFARYIHDHSNRKDGPFIRVNISALASTLVESELFGHKKGSFTDAHGDRQGRFELAKGGTLFLDEIGELPLSVQVKLLRVLQEREVERVGDATAISIDVRLICATHRDLHAMMKQGTFREDLFYRINVFPIYLPPLRERPADLPSLIERLLQRLQTRVARQAQFTPEAIAMLQSYHWPGNVRELENVLERALILANNQEVTAALIVRCLGSLALHNETTNLDTSLLQTERLTLLEALQQAGGSKKRAAEMLGISRSTLYYRLRRVGLETSNEEE
jgi:two-component system, NtrC family, response regulator HydG